MSYKIIVDSCGELPEQLKQDARFQSVPLELDVDDYHVVDDETFCQEEFLRKVKESPNCPKSACPSPQKYYDAYECEAEHIYAVTLSARLSGSFNSAQTAKQMFESDYPDKQVYVFNSCSASIGETLIAMKIQELEEEGCTFEQTVERTQAYIAQQRTFFVLETLETLRKNGRLSNLKAFVANVLNIKPVMGSTPEGEICQLGQAQGINKALERMVQEILRHVDGKEKQMLAIAHCNCPKRAERVKEKLEKLMNFKDILILDTAGISSMYANDGGIIIAV
ncbi:DegV domain-containing protein [Eubacterium plexicaudatum ASF492]|uniref:DegV family EDD domain-containing protein n=1 Tax=Eubacterium plexicaudatum ASF492 TaxID=1235802 RepID=N2ACN4_9FIRM|nr:DegV domain-containing protein [Eubacterium plexicaudatum ASF492]